MGKSKRSAARLRMRPLLLLAASALLLLAVVVGTFVQQCEALEISSSSAGKHLESGEEDCKFCKADVSEDDFELEEAAEMEIDDDDENDDEYEYEDDDEEEDDDDDDDDESDFEGDDFDDEVEDEEGLGVGEEEDEEDVKFDEKDVVVLGSGNFSEFIKSNHYVMVEFYAPWCGHCKALAPEYAEAATILKGEAALAKVDATAHHELGREFSVESYPTVFFFIDGVHKTFSGHRKRDEIVDWVKKKTGLSVASLLSKGEAETIFDSQKSTMAIALLSSLQGSEAAEYTSAARQEDDVLFYQTDSAEVAEVFSIAKDMKRPALVLLKQEPEKVSWFDGPFQRDAIAAFVTKNKLPLVITFNKKNSGLIFESPIKKQVILFAGSDDYKKLSPAFKEASKELMGKLVFVHVDLDDTEQATGIIEFFGLSGDEPAIMGYETQENGRKFLMNGDITAQNVKAFGEGFLSDSLKAHLKSAPVPETNDEDVKTVVGLNLDDIVLEETKDVFLEIYMPGCGHCQALEPIWDKLAKRLRAVESIVIAKMDGTANEHDRAKSDGYPTLIFFPAGKKSFDPVTFDGDRTVKEFIKFLKKEAAIPFTVPKKPDSQDTEKAVEPSINSTSTTRSGEPISESESTTKSAEPGLESVIEESLSSKKDEL